MGLSALGDRLRRFAFAHSKAFPVLGWGGVERWHSLLVNAPITLSRAPHDADLLVLAGEIPQSWGQHLRALLETLSLPRFVLWLAPGWSCDPPPVLAEKYMIAPEKLDDMDWSALIRNLVNFNHPVQRPLLPDQPPAPWRGEGDHGQGGKGMMGGKPFGRPMAMTLEDRDNLALDDVTTALGPHFPGLPSGLQLELKVQGDRIRTCQGIINHFPQRPLTPTLIAHGNPIMAMLAGEAVSVAALEQVRLRSHLGWMADFLEFAGLEGLAQDLRRHRNDADVKTLQRLLKRSENRALRRLTQGIGVITREQALNLNLTGPVARASGLVTDARGEDPAYRALGFEPQVETAGDVWARFRVRVRECHQSLELLHRGGDKVTRAREGARGYFSRTGDGDLNTPSKANLAALKPGLAGLEWFEAVLFSASLDLDMTEAALK